MFRFAFLVASSKALILKAPFGAQDDEFVDDTAERNAMYDCSGGAVAPGTEGASNDMAMRVVAAKVAAIGGSDPEDLDSFKDSVKKVHKFKRYAAQDCEGKDSGSPLKKDMDNESPYVHKKNFHGPDSDVEKANALTSEALEKVAQIKREILGDQFAKVEEA